MRDEFRCVQCRGYISSDEAFWKVKGGAIHDICRSRLTIDEWEDIKR